MHAELAEALRSYASHLEPSFLSIKLPPTSPNSKAAPTFDISPSYVNSLDTEFTKVYDEYNRRIVLIQSMAEDMVMLWGELGTPQAQIDSTIVKHYRDAPEQLGLHQDDLAKIKAKRDKLIEEKRAREQRLKDLRSTVESLWDKLGIEDARKAFLAANRGCGMRAINEFEEELAKLEELKRQNLHLFVEDARFKLQELWDGLYFSEEEMLDFTPAFSGMMDCSTTSRAITDIILDVYSDALLSAHEAEIKRLEALKQQRAPMLASVDKYRELIKAEADLDASAADASRLMAKGAKGERRDPTRLLREEKMRNRTKRELPNAAAELRKVIDAWEEEYGRPFLVHGERFLDRMELDKENSKILSGASGRSRATTKAAVPTANTKTARAAPSATRSVSTRDAPPPRSKTPTASMARNPLSQSVMSNAPSTMKPSAKASTVRGSPSKIPGRQPLGALADGKNSPERRPRTAGGYRSAAEENNHSIKVSPSKAASVRTNTVRMGPPRLPPPPKMKDLYPPTPTPMQHSESASDLSSVIVRHMDMEDPYDDRSYRSHPSGSSLASSLHSSRIASTHTTLSQHRIPLPAAHRQISAKSNASGSENWETYTDASASEHGRDDDVDDEMFARAQRAAKRPTPDGGHDELIPHGQRTAWVADKKMRANVQGGGGAMLGLGLHARMGAAPGMAREGTGESEGWTDDGSVF